VLRDLLQLGFGIEGEEIDTRRMGKRDVGRLLDGVAEGDLRGLGAGSQHLADLAGGGRVEAGAERHQAAENLRRRVGLHRIEDFSGGECRAQIAILAADDVEIDHQAGRRGFGTLEIRDDPGMIRRQGFWGRGDRQLKVRIGHSGRNGTAAADLGEVVLHLSLFFHFVH